jgi:hypothetical protein
MKRAIILSAAAFFAISAPIAAMAAGLGVNAHANVHASSNGVGVTTGTTSEGGAMSSVKTATHANASASSPSYGTIISAIAAGKDQSLPASVTSVKVVTLASLKGSAATHAKAVAQLTKKHAASIKKLEAAVEADTTLMAKLTAAGYTADQVVAVTSSASGSVTLYVNA